MKRTRSIVLSLVLILSLLLSTAGILNADASHAAAKKTHLKKTSVTLEAGQTFQQRLVSAQGKYIKAAKIKWKSSKRSVAKISKKGKVTAVKAGTAKMTAKYRGKTYRFTVTVRRTDPRPWQGKTIKCFGDSRTWYDGQAYLSITKPEYVGKICVGYQQTLAALTGATVVSEATSGAISAEICKTIREADLTGIDAVFLEGGVNDWGQSHRVTIGSLLPPGSEFDTNTVYGAWQSAIEHIQSNYPDVRIYMDIPAIAWTAAGLYPYSSAEIKGQIAELYHIPCCDLYTACGINEQNRDDYFVDDVAKTNWWLHFNEEGNVLIGRILAEFMNTQ